MGRQDSADEMANLRSGIIGLLYRKMAIETPYVAVLEVFDKTMSS
jgi:hypothetical protein